jgi:RNA polymerase sigma factor (sigma-70 family)
MADRPSRRYHALLVAAQGYGDEADEALEDFLTVLCGPLRRYALARLCEHHDAGDAAEDVVQETLIRIAKGVRACTAATDGQVWAWTRAIAKNIIIDFLRAPSSGSAAQELAQERHEEICRNYACVTEIDELRSPALTSLLGLVMTAYGDVLESTAELFWLRLIMGLEWTEIGPLLSTSASGAKRRFQRAQASMQRDVLERVALLPSKEQASVRRFLARFGGNSRGAGATVPVAQSRRAISPQASHCRHGAFPDGAVFTGVPLLQGAAG